MRPIPWLPALAQKQFWIDWLHFDQVALDYPNYTFAFPLPQSFNLVLSVNSNLWYRELHIHHPDAAEPIKLGWNDGAHWHPFVFRDDELEAICQCLSKHNPLMKHPGIPFLLLVQFACISRLETDQIEIRKFKVKEAYESLDIFASNEIEQLVRDTLHFLPHDMYWSSHAEYGWVMDGNYPYSLRIASNKDFPFKLFNNLLDAARSCLNPDLT